MYTVANTGYPSMHFNKRRLVATRFNMCAETLDQGFESYTEPWTAESIENTELGRLHTYITHTYIHTLINYTKLQRVEPRVSTNTPRRFCYAARLKALRLISTAFLLLPFAQ